MNYIAFDSHKRYTLASVESPTGQILQEKRIEHNPGALCEFLSQHEKGSPVAVETIGNWYWIVDEIEQAGMIPKLVNARKAKKMSGSINKTDKLDARGLNLLQRAGVLPTVWIPPADLRDKRDLPRTRMALTNERTKLKNRIQASLSKYRLNLTGVSDTFGVKSTDKLNEHISALPVHTRYSTERLMEQLRFTETQIGMFEKRIKEVFKDSAELKRIMSLPGVGYILGIVILLEVGDIGRFGGAPQLASYAGCTPRVHASGDKMRFGQLRPDVNHYLKWAFTEAANVISTHRKHWAYRHSVRLYNRIAARKNHQKAVGAVARHLAEATYWMLRKEEDYKEPKSISEVIKGEISAMTA